MDSTTSSQPTSDLSYDDIINKDILELMGVQDMPEAVRQDLYSKMIDTIQRRVVVRVSENILEEDSDQWQQVANNNDIQAMDEFLSKRGIKIGEIIFQETLVYKTEMVKSAAPIRQLIHKHSN